MLKFAIWSLPLLTLYWILAKPVELLSEPREYIIQHLREAGNAQGSQFLSSQTGRIDYQWSPMLVVGLGIFRTIDDIETWILLLYCTAGLKMRQFFDTIQPHIPLSHSGSAASFLKNLVAYRNSRPALYIVASTCLLAMAIYLYDVFATNGTLAHIYLNNSSSLKTAAEISKGLVFMFAILCVSLLVLSAVSMASAIEPWVFRSCWITIEESYNSLLLISKHAVVLPYVFIVIFAVLVSYTVIPDYSVTLWPLAITRSLVYTSPLMLLLPLLVVIATRRGIRSHELHIPFWKIAQ